ncbi:hypothetical protein LTR64_000858 [Lithohypha guttulata]|uniref:uncharacterized protein n=1 Tax=Lithohypha guttulata TaxID=1690604 RepID=UPI002DDE56B1|nr:hypothetical protein LTR51_003052 [Lithohypha guttulata]
MPSTTRYFDSPKFPTPSLRRKSKSINHHSHPNPNTSFPAGEASPVRLNGPEPVYTPQPPPQQSRRRSSWYSQRTVGSTAVSPMPPPPLPLSSAAGSVHSNPYGQMNPYAPQTASTDENQLTSEALKSSDSAMQRAAQDARRRSVDSWEDDEPQSPGGGTAENSSRSSASARYDTSRGRQQHTAMSEYLKDRSWGSYQQQTHPRVSGVVERSVETPMAPRGRRHATPRPIEPVTPPPPPPAAAQGHTGTVSSIFRRFSLSSSGASSRRDTRRESGSSTTTLPFVMADGTQRVTETPMARHESQRRKSSLGFSSPLSMLKHRFEKTPVPEPQVPMRSSAYSGAAEPSQTLPANVYVPPSRSGTTSQLVATPYSATRRGPSPVMVATLPEHVSHQQQPRHDGAYASGPVRPAVQPQSLRSEGVQSVPPPPQSNPYLYRASSKNKPAHSTPIRTTAPPASHHSHAQVLLRPNLITSVASYMKTELRDPYECTDQGAWLAIGTMRGPTPSGVRTINAIMAKAIEKGKPQKGQKEVEKMLRDQKRSVIEWVEDYLRIKWETLL